MVIVKDVIPDCSKHDYQPGKGHQYHNRDSYKGL